MKSSGGKAKPAPAPRGRAQAGKGGGPGKQRAAAASDPRTVAVRVKGRIIAGVFHKDEEAGEDLTPMPLLLPERRREVPVELVVPETPAVEDQEDVQTAYSSNAGMPYDGEISDDDDVEEEHKGQPVVLKLCESATMTLLHISGVCVATDFVGKAKIEERNAAYEAMVAERLSSDRFVVRHAQTLNYAQKDVAAMATPATTAEVECQSSSWDIYDANAAHEASLQDGDEEGGGGLLAQRGARSEASKQTEAQVEKTVAVAMAAENFLLPCAEASAKSTAQLKPGQDLPTLPGCVAGKRMSRDQILLAQQARELLRSRQLAQSLAIMERCVQQNLFHTKQLQYRDHLSATTKDAAKLAEDDAKTAAENEDLADELAAAETGEGDPAGEGAAEDSGAQAEAGEASGEAAGAAAGSAASAGEAAAAAESGSTSAGAAQAASNGGVNGAANAQSEAGGAASGGAAAAQAQAQAPSEAGLEQLWSWSAPVTKGRTVTAMSWNKVNEDVLAVAYGSFSYAPPSSGGLVLFWSLRNPTYPERVLELVSGATALDFSRKAPHLLAVGTHDGAVAIFNVRQIVSEQSPSLSQGSGGTAYAVPVLDSEHTAGKHTDPVWQVQWVDKGAERGESLVSISTDGRVVEWSMKKGLEETTLMVLKRVGNSEGVISRQASGLCFDFALDDAAIYLAGTEDGLLHKCSCSYNEQYLETYQGHTGPVYRLRCSPFWPNAFLSCSADWTVKLWDHKKPTKSHSFHSVDLADVVHDVAWSPHCSTIFASVAGDGRIEIWDLEHSTLDPVVRVFQGADTHSKTNLHLSSADADHLQNASDPSDSGGPAEDVNAGALSAKNESGSGGSGTAGSSKGSPDQDADQSAQHDPRSRSQNVKTPQQAGGDRGDRGLTPGASSTAVLFANNAPVLVVGDSHGAVTCYCIKGVGPKTQLPVEQQIAALKSAMSPEKDLESAKPPV